MPDAAPSSSSTERTVSALSEKNSNEKRKGVVVQGRDIYEYRAFYKKFERAKYISHLDLYRAIQRAIGRANLPVWFTEGYHPHIYLTFPMPIFLGCEGIEESFDFRTVEDCEPEELMERLNHAFPEGIRVTRIAAPVHKPAEIVSADYTVLFSGEGIDGHALREKWDEFLSGETIPAVKHTKKGPKEIDIKPMIASCETENNGDGLLIRMRTACGIEENLNVTLVIDTFGAKNGIEITYHLIRREQMLLSDGSRFC